jgi:aspartate ammonia-lyase
MSTAERPLWGPETEKALENFRVAGRPVDPVMIHCYGHVKRAAATTNHSWGISTLGGTAVDPGLGRDGPGRTRLPVVVDALQGGAAPPST